MKIPCTIVCFKPFVEKYFSQQKISQKRSLLFVVFWILCTNKNRTKVLMRFLTFVDPVWVERIFNEFSDLWSSGDFSIYVFVILDERWISSLSRKGKKRQTTLAIRQFLVFEFLFRWLWIKIFDCLDLDEQKHLIRDTSFASRHAIL